MDLAKVLVELRRELANLDAAIISLERLQAGGRKRGRPPQWLSELRKPDEPKRVAKAQRKAE
jgi:hypothetical protein